MKMDDTKIIHDLKAPLSIHAAFYNTLSQAYYYTRNFTNALYFSNLSIQLDSNSKNTSELYVIRACIRWKVGELRNAKIDLKKAIEIDTNENAKNLLEEISNLNN